MESAASTHMRVGILASAALAAAALALALVCGPMASQAHAAGNGETYKTKTISTRYYQCSECEFNTFVDRGNSQYTSRESYYQHCKNKQHNYDAINNLVSDTKQVEVQTVYRMYNPITSEHLFTTSYSEYQSLVNHDWKQEGEAWDAATPSSGTKGVYRLYNPGLGALCKMSHHYTTNKNEADNLVKSWGWVYDNDGQPVFYSATDSYGIANGAWPVYRLYNPGLSAHHYCTDLTEWAWLTASGKSYLADWKDEGADFFYYN